MKKINLLLSGALTLALFNPIQVLGAQPTTGKVKSLPQAQQTKLLQSLMSSNGLNKDLTETIKFDMKSKVDAKYAKLIEAPSSFNFSTKVQYDKDKDVCDTNIDLGANVNIPSAKLYNTYFGGSAWAEVQNIKDLGNLNVFFKLTKISDFSKLPASVLGSTEAQMGAAMLPSFTNKLFRVSMKDVLKLDPSMQKELQPTFDAYKKLMGGLGTMDTKNLQKTYKPLLDTATYTISGNKMTVNFIIPDLNKFSNDMIAGLNLQQLFGGTSLAQGLDLKGLTDKINSTDAAAKIDPSKSSIKNVKYSITLTNNVMTSANASFIVSDTEKVNGASVPVQYQANLACTMNYSNVNITPKKSAEATDIMSMLSLLKK